MSQNTEIQPLLPAAPIQQPASWLGFKLINQAAANELGAAVLPSANSLAGNVLCALTDADGDALYVAGIVVAVTFTASSVRYSVAFPVAPQPRAGMTMYAVVENIESGLLLADLPDGETVFDSVLTEDAAALIQPVKLVLDGVNPLQLAALEGQLVERRAALAELVESDPVAALAVARDVIALASQVMSAEPVSPAVAELGKALSVVENNEPINRAEGNDEQADLEARTAESLKAAIKVLTAHSEQYESYRADIEKQLAEGGTIPAGMLEQIQLDERLNDGEAAQLEALATPAQTITSKASMETLIKIAADTVAQLRRIDVYRVLDAAGDQRADLATFITTQRPDLVREVTDVMAEEWPVLGWALAAAADGGNAEHGQNPARAADLTFLNSVISKSVDMWDDALADKIEGMGATYEGDAEVVEVWGRAIVAYTDFMVAAMG